MPEGAEVRRCSEDIRYTLINKTIRVLEPVSGKLLKTGISGETITGKVTKVYSKGKVIIIETDSGKSIVSTLGMSGWWYPDSTQLNVVQLAQKTHYNNVEVETSKIIKLAERHIRARIICEDNTILNYSDTRNFGNLYITDKYGVEQKLSKLGPDILNEFIHLDIWINTWRNKKFANKEIGALLLSQEIFCGLGNIYRAETCYLANVSPFTLIKDISDEKLKHLLSAAIHVLDVAYRTGVAKTANSVGYDLNLMESIFKDKLNPLKEKLIARFNTTWKDILAYGYYGRLLVYGQSVSPLNELVKKDTLGGRTIWYV
jgi:formamidopyrimidine-DNA glycosylase